MGCGAWSIAGRPAVGPRPGCRLRDRIAELVQTRYRDSMTATRPKTPRLEGLPVSRSTVRRFRRALGLPPKRRRRPPQHRARRPRHPAMGRLVLVDGSPFDWPAPDPSPAPRSHRRCDEHRPGPAFPARGGPPWLSHPAPATRHAPRAARDPLRRSARRLRPDRCPLELGGGAPGAQHRPTSARSCGTSPSATSAPTRPEAKGRIERLWDTLQIASSLNCAGRDHHRGRRRNIPAHPSRGPQRRFAQPPAEPAAVWRRPPRDLVDRLSCRYTRSRGAGQHRPARPAVGPDPSRSPRPVLRPVPRRRARMSRWPAARGLSGAPRLVTATAAGERLHSSSPGGRTASAPPRARLAEGGRHLPLGQNGRSSAIAALHGLGPATYAVPARPHPWRRTFSRRQRERQRQETLTT